MQNKRICGIDLLKIVSMFMVVLIHILLHGGILDVATKQGTNLYTSGLLYSLALPAVNCFAMTTGFLMAKTSFKFERVINLWFQVFCYSAGITLIMFLIFQNKISLDDCLQSIFPVSFSQYWYFTAYFGMFILSPVLNIALSHLSKNQLLGVLITAFIFFSVLPTVFGRDIFHINGGYSMLWLCVDYLIGGYISKHGLNLKNKRFICFFAYIICSLAVFLYQYVYSKGQTGRFSLIEYSSPFIVVSAISLLLLFSSIQIKNGKIQNIASYLSKVSFGVYLFHEQPAIRKLFIENNFSFLASKSPIMFLVIFLAIVLAIYIVGSLVDSVRYGVFKLLKINKITSALVDKIKKKIFGTDSINETKSEN